MYAVVFSIGVHTFLFCHSHTWYMQLHPQLKSSYNYAVCLGKMAQEWRQTHKKMSFFAQFLQKMNIFCKIHFRKKWWGFERRRSTWSFSSSCPKFDMCHRIRKFTFFQKKCILKGFSTKLHVEYSTVARIKYWKNFPKQILQTFRLEVGDRLCYIHHHTEMLI